MTDKTLVKFAQIRPLNGGHDWVVGADEGGLLLGKVQQSAGDAGLDDAAADIEVWARSTQIYKQAIRTLVGETRMLTDPRLALLLASGVVMLTGLLKQQQAVAADLERQRDEALGLALGNDDD